ncbi:MULTISPECIES: hypothetical protein [Thalassotalea]|uniref:Aldose 1-epimerase n=1 Tax=Thalassotalea castellviae TaxID=3075612 RepID=A0ABU2ZVS6_9GAMM|nr:hypothetical protein [Thalassotalea sp. W431]MDT0602033.1 hypothetical protein [Thalassotalea sp. W431]
MAVYTLSNNLLTCQINERGAELNSLVSTTHHQEYIWQADPAIWAGSAPILFPVVGRLNEGEYRYQGKDYAIPIPSLLVSSKITIWPTGSVSPVPATSSI